MPVTVSTSGLTLKTLSPLHHGFTEPATVTDTPRAHPDDRTRTETVRLMRTIPVLCRVTPAASPDDAPPPDDAADRWRVIPVPVLGGNALRARLRRAAAYGTLEVLGLEPAAFDTPHGRVLFHLLTSGGTLLTKKASGAATPASAADCTPAARDRALALWPLLTLFGASLQDQPLPGKLHVSFGWPLIRELQPIIGRPDDAALFGERWDAVPAEWLLQGGLRHSGDFQDVHAAHVEYRHPDRHRVPMPTSRVDKSGADRDEEGGMVMAYQYVPPGVSFGVRITGFQLTPDELACLRFALDRAFPLQGVTTFGGRAATGLGLLQVTRHQLSADLPDAARYVDFLHAHRDELRDRLTTPRGLFGGYATPKSSKRETASAGDSAPTAGASA